MTSRRGSAQVWFWKDDGGGVRSRWGVDRESIGSQYGVSMESRLGWIAAGRTISDEDLAIVEGHVKKKCRGVLDVASRCANGHPEVIRYYPMSKDAEGKATAPFPTLFWLVCPEIIRQVSVLEARGGVSELEARLAEDPDLQEAIRRNHESYREERWSLLDDDDRQTIDERGWRCVYDEQGIGGIADWRYVKCLHLHYAHHRARKNVIGALVEEIAGVRLCR